MKEFKHNHINISCPQSWYEAILEVYILDVYRTDLINENDLVFDLGAGIGDFAVLASKKVGKNGKVVAIEPDVENYHLLKFNIHKNQCQNVIPLNLGIAGVPGTRDLVTQSGSSTGCRFQVDTLENIVANLKIIDKINFIKMDIEGFEAEVISKSIGTIREASVISLECHNTKHSIDKILPHYGFSFKPITMGYIFKKAIRGLILYRTNYFKAYALKPQIIYKAMKGFEITKNNELLVGSYIKNT